MDKVRLRASEALVALLLFVARAAFSPQLAEEEHHGCHADHQKAEHRGNDDK
jgi:hypothetical protein